METTPRPTGAAPQRQSRVTCTHLIAAWTIVMARTCMRRGCHAKATHAAAVMRVGQDPALLALCVEDFEFVERYCGGGLK